MIWTNLYIQAVEKLEKFFSFLPDFNFTVDDEILNSLGKLFEAAQYFIPFEQLKGILIIEFSLINFSLFVSAYKGLKGFIK